MAFCSVSHVKLQINLHISKKKQTKIQAFFIFLPKILRIPNICCKFAADFNKISEVVLPILKKKQVV
jgi:hypothetical protein